VVTLCANPPTGYFVAFGEQSFAMLYILLSLIKSRAFELRGVFEKKPKFLNSVPTSTESAHVFLFPKLNTTLKERLFQTIEEIQENAVRELRAITESAFQEAFQQRNKGWERCIASRGDYLEGDSA
jgi:hypothetical protein